MERCPFQRVIQGGDESMENCTIRLRDRQCVLIGGYECDEYNEFLKEEERCQTK